VIDATDGAVRLISTAPGGGVQDAVFSGGEFRVTQTRGRRPVAELRLVGRLPRCGGRRAGKRRLWGDGDGSFLIRGRRSAATASGARWLVQDSCAGTLTRVARGKAQVRDFGMRRTVTVRAGQR
jgi:hypothetical protein